MTAKSRLSPETHKTLSQNNTKNRNRQSSNLYSKHLLLLILSGVFYLIVFYLLTNFPPKSVANVPLTNLYLPLLLPFFLANYFLISFILLNTKRGFIFSLLLTCLLFFKLQQISFEVWWLIILTLIFIVFGTIFSRKKPS